MTRKIPPETIIFRILSEVRDGKADSDELVRLLEQFCEKSRKELSTNPELAYVVQSIGRFLDQSTPTLDEAFGFAKRKKGRPLSDNGARDQDAARKILEKRLDGMSHEDARACVAESVHLSDSSLNDIWRRNKQNALMLARVERLPGSWTEEEKNKLITIFKGEDWFRAE